VKRILRFGLAALGLVLALAAAGLGLAHREIRGRDPALPADDEVLALAGVTGGPTAIAWHETSSQGLPRRQVLDPELDASPDEPYVMSHPSFALAWPDGQLLLVDLGMEHEAAVAFSRPLRWVGGGIPLTFGGPAEALGPASARVAGVIFSHLHTDHVEGALGLCAARSAAPLPVFQTAAQAELANYTTRPGRSLLERAGCLAPRRLEGAPLAPVPGFPGVGVVDAAGHTPGSQVVLAVVTDGARTRRLAFTGDVANHVGGIRQNVGKPLLYRSLMVPESEPRLARVRGWLQHLERDLGFELLVAHDHAQLASLGLPGFAALLGPERH
jgi:glyoxylase-like metal-dependent hydrolase (beta-lactamase superfamily II)